MEITKEYLQERLSEFQQQKEDAIGHLGAVKGAIQFCTFLILEKEREEGDVGRPDPAPSKEKE